MSSVREKEMVRQTSSIRETILKGSMKLGDRNRLHVNSFKVADTSVTGTSVDFQRDQEEAGNHRKEQVGMTVLGDRHCLVLPSRG